MRRYNGDGWSLSLDPSNKFNKMVTIKYDEDDGKQKWVRFYDGPGFDSGRAIAVDCLGHVHVASATEQLGKGRDKSFDVDPTYDYATSSTERTAPKTVPVT